MILNLVTTHDWIPNRVNVPCLYHGLCLISTFYTRRIICYLSFGQIAYNLPECLFMNDPTGQTQAVYLRDVKYSKEVFQDLLNQPNAQAARLRLFLETSKYGTNEQLYNTIKKDFYTYIKKDSSLFYRIFDYIDYMKAVFLYDPIDEKGINFVLDLCEKNQECKISLNNIAKYDIYVFRKSLPKMSYRLLNRLSNILYRTSPIQLQITEYKIKAKQKEEYNNDV